MAALGSTEHWELDNFDRALLTFLHFAASPLGKSIYGAEHLLALKEPFIISANHTTRFEAIALPATLMYIGGRPIRFLSDWNFLMIPGLHFILRRGRTIPVTTKLARPRWLTFMRSALVRGKVGLNGAREALWAGNSIGIFPEGKANHNPATLLPGHLGAAILSLESGAPILPVGIRYPGTERMNRVPELYPMEIYIGSPLWPDDQSTAEPAARFHDRMMSALEELSGKKRINNTKERGDYVTTTI